MGHKTHHTLKKKVLTNMLSEAYTPNYNAIALQYQPNYNTELHRWYFKQFFFSPSISLLEILKSI
jgi:hypothetical protein